MGVNDLAAKWREEVQAIERVSGQLPNAKYGKGTRLGCAEDMRHVSHSCWHPVSDPPTKADGDENGNVAIHGKEGVEVLPWGEVPCCCLKGDSWARVRDVVLLPPEGEGE